MGQIYIRNGRFRNSNDADCIVLPLSGRQLDCMTLVKEGLTTKQIARELGISPRTVDQHIGAALGNLGCANRTAAVALMHEFDRRVQPGSEMPLFVSSADTLGDPVIHTGVIISQPDSKVPGAPMDSILPRLGGARNTARSKLRMTWIFRIAVICSMLTCFLILSVIAASALAEGLAE